MKRIISILAAAALTAALTVSPAKASYPDVPSGGALASEVEKAVSYGLMFGYSPTRFGYGDPMTRAQFVTVLGRMMNWAASPMEYTITDAMEIPAYLPAVYRNAIHYAVKNDVIDADRPFQPNRPVTRGEMAEMLVRALGLKCVAAIAEKENSLPFKDVTDRRGYISVACDIGMAGGTSASSFSPDSSATRAQAAAMLVRVYERLQQKIGWTHGFYAISSYSQLSLTDYMDAISVGWSRMTWDGKQARLSTSSADGGEYYLPSGYKDVVTYLAQGRKPLHLNVFMDGTGVRELLADSNGRSQAVRAITRELTIPYSGLGKNPYSGITIQFEGLRAASRDSFTAFLEELSGELRRMGKTLYVCVFPVLANSAYYDGYDYSAIAGLADRMILMAHDYDARDLSAFVGTEYYKNIAPAPIDQVYISLKAVVRAVSDTSKLVIAFSCKNIAWQIDENDRLVSGRPQYPTNETIYKRLEQDDTVRGWSDTYQTSYIIYTTETGERYFAWYDDSSSIQVKLNAAKLLGITNVSIWRLGIIPTRANFNWMNLLSS